MRSGSTVDEAHEILASDHLYEWGGLIGFEGVETVDGRMIAPGDLDISREGLPLMAVGPQDDYHVGHAGARSVGVITTVERWGTAIVARGLVNGELLARVALQAERPVRVPCGFDLDAIHPSGSSRVPTVGDPFVGAMRGARLMGVTLYLGGQLPAFPEACIVIEELVA